MEVEVEGWTVCGRASARIGYRKVSLMALTGLAEASRSNRSRAVGERGYGCGVREDGARRIMAAHARRFRGENFVALEAAGKLGENSRADRAIGNYFPVTGMTERCDRTPSRTKTEPSSWELTERSLFSSRKKRQARRTAKQRDGRSVLAEKRGTIARRSKLQA